MVRFVSLVFLLCMALQASGQNLGISPGQPLPLESRQGGDDWDQAVLIPEIPYAISGTNVGYSVNCCWDMCPYEAWGPAVFYRLVPDRNLAARIDLCGSNFDTGLYVFDADRNLVSCNIDHYFGPPCGLYVSCIEHVLLDSGETYYIVVTGMGGDSGNYNIEITEYEDCSVSIPPGAMPEGEPELVDGYLDEFNGGCNSLEFGAPFQDLIGEENGHLAFHGIGGWISDSYPGSRDTDWFTAIIGGTGLAHATIQADADSYLFQLAPLNCEVVAVVQSALSQECQAVSLEIQGEPGELVWLWAGSADFHSPWYIMGNEYSYLLTLEGLMSGPVATEFLTWDALRALYRGP